MNGGARGLGTVCFEGWEIMEGKENTIVFISLREIYYSDLRISSPWKQALDVARQRNTPVIWIGLEREKWGSMSPILPFAAMQAYRASATRASYLNYAENLVDDLKI
jgi:hypothetical protein